MQLAFDSKLVEGYESKSQKVRVMTEHWVDKWVFCPNCGRFNLDKYVNNKPVADFYCNNCSEDYELKSKQSSFGAKVVDGAYQTMIKRLESINNPNFFLLNYDLKDFSVLNFFVIPKHFLIPCIIEKRKALSQTAKRSGWVGCNILLQSIPQSGKIFFVKNRQIESKENVITNWHKTLFLRDENEISTKGWLLDIMNCLEQLEKKEFTLNEIYLFENFLSKKHPNNKHIKDKIRQQLQILRNKEYLEFTKRGRYRII